MAEGAGADWVMAAWKRMGRDFYTSRADGETAPGQASRVAFVGTSTEDRRSGGRDTSSKDNTDMIRRTFALAACLTGAVALSACTTTDPYTGEVVRNNTGTGAVIGAIGGGLLGYLSNTSDSEQGRKNALLGAGIGGLAGTGVGAYMDRQQADLRRELADSGVSVTRDGDNLILNMPSDVTFASNSESLQPQFYDTLDAVGRVLGAYPSTLLDIVGHADSDGADDYNLALSERRARSVADYLVRNARLNPDRVALAGRGERDPIASNATAAGKAQNRRVEIVIRPLRG